MDSVSPAALVLWAIAGVAGAFADVTKCQYPAVLPNASSCETFQGEFPCCPFDGDRWPGYTAARARQAKDPELLAELVAGNASLNLLPLTFRPPRDWHWARHTASIFAVSLDVRRISNIRQKEQTFSMHYVTSVSYRDCRLLHNCSYIRLEDRHPLYSRVWLPRLDIAEREDNVESMTEGDLAWVPDGLTTAREVRVSTFRCSFNFADLPFDSHDCKLTLHIGGESLHDFDLVWAPTALQVSRVENGAWEIPERKDWRMSRGVDMMNVYGGDRNPVCTLRVEFTLRRRARYYIINFVLPATVIWLTSWVGLWIDPAAVPARAALGIIPVLIITNMLNRLAAVLPAISATNRLEQFLMVIQVLVFLQLLGFAAVNYCARWYRALSAQEEIVAPDGQPRMDLRVTRFVFERKLRVTRFVGARLDFHARWISVLAFLVAGISIFA